VLKGYEFVNRTRHSGDTRRSQSKACSLFTLFRGTQRLLAYLLRGDETNSSQCHVTNSPVPCRRTLEKKGEKKMARYEITDRGWVRRRCAYTVAAWPENTIVGPFYKYGNTQTQRRSFFGHYLPIPLRARP